MNFNKHVQALDDDEISFVNGGVTTSGTSGSVVDEQLSKVTCPFCNNTAVFKGIRTSNGQVNEYMPFHCKICGKAWKGTYVTPRHEIRTVWRDVTEVPNEY